MKTYKVVVSFEIKSEESKAFVQKKTSALLDFGAVRDSFDAADLDASGFNVLYVVEEGKSS